MAENSNSNLKDNNHLLNVTSPGLKPEKDYPMPESPEQTGFLPGLETTLKAGEMQVGSDDIEMADDSMGAEQIFPPRYNKVIPYVVQITEAGFVCFLNPESLELEQVTGQMLANPEAFYATSGGSAGQKPFQHLLWNDCVMFEPVPEKELLHLVEDFMQYLAGDTFHDKLARSMMKGKPYKKLDVLICKSQHAAFWDQYKTKRLENMVKDKLAYHYTYHSEQFKQKG